MASRDELPSDTEPSSDSVRPKRFLDLLAEIRDHIYTMRVATLKPFFPIKQYKIIYSMLMPLMTASDQIAKEIRPIMLAENGIHLIPTTIFMSKRWRLPDLPPPELRPFFKRVKVSLHVPEDLEGPGLDDVVYEGEDESDEDESDNDDGTGDDGEGNLVGRLTNTEDKMQEDAPENDAPENDAPEENAPEEDGPGEVDFQFRCIDLYGDFWVDPLVTLKLEGFSNIQELVVQAEYAAETYLHENEDGRKVRTVITDKEELKRWILHDVEKMFEIAPQAVKMEVFLKEVNY